MTHLIHGSRWNDELLVMLHPVSADEARAAYENGTEVSVAGGPEPLLGMDPDDLDAPDGEDPASWVIYSRLADGYLEVTFYNLWGTKEARHSFRRQDDGRLFLSDVVEYDQVDPTDPEAAWSTLTERHFRPDGYSSTVTRTAVPDGSEDVEMVEHRGGDFSTHYEPVPAFGQWAGVLKRQR